MSTEETSQKKPRTLYSVAFSAEYTRTVRGWSRTEADIWANDVAEALQIAQGIADIASAERCEVHDIPNLPRREHPELRCVREDNDDQLDDEVEVGREYTAYATVESVSPAQYLGRPVVEEI